MSRRPLLYVLPLLSLQASSVLAASCLCSRSWSPVTQTDGPIVQLFEWSWSSVAAECTAFLGPAGYKYVQVSPPQEHVTGSQWWTDYQPVSYHIVSKRGNRSDFQNMVNTCHAAGVKVIADTIWNHMAGTDSGTGVDGSTFTHYAYPGIYSSWDFHHCGLTSNDDISDYTSRAQVQTCELSNLADLATDTEYVRTTLANYANDLLSLGVDGLRLDAAKHIATGDILNILNRLSASVYITQEVIYGSGEAVQPSEYVGNGAVQEFRFTYALLSAFSGGNIASLSDITSRGWIDSSLANVFVANHDTERSGTGITYKWDRNAYVLATIFSLGFGYGTPTVLSGYSFTNNDAGAPNNNYGTCSGTGGSNGWLCQHRWIAFSGMIGFYNAVTGSSLSGWTVGTNAQIAWHRQNKGFVAINYETSTWTKTFSTAMTDGVYCNVIDGALSGNSCTGTSITVSGGSFTVSISTRNAIAFHRASRIGGVAKRDLSNPPPIRQAHILPDFVVAANHLASEDATDN